MHVGCDRLSTRTAPSGTLARPPTRKLLVSKLLVLVIVVALVYWIVKRFARKSKRDSATRYGGSVGEDMVRCAHCGVHLPRSESVMQDSVFFCTPEHRRVHHKHD
jgi:uncharacterized protein